VSWLCNSRANSSQKIYLLFFSDLSKTKFLGVHLLEHSSVREYEKRYSFGFRDFEHKNIPEHEHKAGSVSTGRYKITVFYVFGFGTTVAMASGGRVERIRP